MEIVTFKRRNTILKARMKIRNMELEEITLIRYFALKDLNRGKEAEIELGHVWDVLKQRGSVNLTQEQFEEGAEWLCDKYGSSGYNDSVYRILNPLLHVRYTRRIPLNILVKILEKRVARRDSIEN